MTDLSEAERSRIYTELTEATSTRTAEVLMRRIVEAPWDNLVTNDHLDAQLTKFRSGMDTRFAQIDARFADIDARFADIDAKFADIDARFDLADAKADARFAQQDAKFERVIRKQLIWTISALLTFNGLLAAWFTAFT